MTQMLISRENLQYDFRGAQFDPGQPADRKFLAWVFNQFLYGEVTGIQCGHWLYKAPHLNAAMFLAKQAGEELAHVKKILRILTLLKEQPDAAHPAVRFLSTGMMGGSWGEHVVLEMALGEGLVLAVFYALANTIPDPDIKKILESALSEEERHVAFGEKETRVWLEEFPSDRGRLLALALIQFWALRWLKGFVVKKLKKQGFSGHPVLSQFDSFFDHVRSGFERRIELLGLAKRPVKDMGWAEKALLVASLPLLQLSSRFRFRRKPLTSIYLDDPVINSERERLLSG